MILFLRDSRMRWRQFRSNCAGNFFERISSLFGENIVMTSCKWIILAGLFAVAFGCNAQPNPSVNALQVEMIFWESQSWETGGGKSRLTIWADGRSEIMVVPDAFLRRRTENVRPRDGWSMKQDLQSLYLVRTNVYPEKVAKEKFSQALSAGIHLLETFPPDYVDGSGTLVGVQINGELKETIIPMFLDQRRETANHRRYLAVSKILADFDKPAYDIQN